MICGKIIREFREKRSMSLKELAEKAGLSVSYLCEIERGKKLPSIEVIEKLAAALNISKDALFEESPSKKGPSTSPGERISILRRERGLSLSELAERAGISATYLCQIENGKVLPSLATLKAIAKALNANPQDFLSATHISYKIKKIRLERGITQAELAKKAGVSTGLIGQIESGKVEPSIKTLEKISNALSVSPCYFISDDDDINSLLRPMNPELKKLLTDPKVRSFLEMVADCTQEEFMFIMKFVQLYKEHRPKD
ncbi:MAG: helix-turn-helix domain-containing protein [Bacillota bacterium]|nr:MAG: transcriptional regulator [Bacillota bacterium]